MYCNRSQNLFLLTCGKQKNIRFTVFYKNIYGTDSIIFSVLFFILILVINSCRSFFSIKYSQVSRQKKCQKEQKIILNFLI